MKGDTAEPEPGGIFLGNHANSPLTSAAGEQVIPNSGKTQQGEVPSRHAVRVRGLPVPVRVITENQQDVVTFLSSCAAHGGAAVERIDSHASIVFLAGERAWKLKRAVRYDYLDYSTADQRHTMCEAEVQINRRSAPALYRGVTAVMRRTDGQLAIGGSGTPVDWLVEMSRFDQRLLFDHMAEAGVLPLQLMRPLAAAIARLHSTADCRTNHGGWKAMRRVIDGNAAAFGAEAADILDRARCRMLTSRARIELDHGDVLIESRRVDGWVRHCHGDLHLRNIVLLDGQPTLFDAIEFNDDISSIDVLYDLAFVLMDLWRLGLPHHANIVWNGYLEEMADLDGLALMPLFLSCRAAIIAKTTATSANLQTDASQRLVLQTVANDYLTMAETLLAPPRPRLVAIGGLSGSGKSTLAGTLAPSLDAPPGAVVIRSDEIRKRLCGVKPLDRLGPEGYTDEMTRRVYATLMEHAHKVLYGGYTAIIDAVFAEPADRAAMAHVARTAGVPFVGIWLEAAKPILLSRIERREPDASDAGIDVVHRQLARRLEAVEWHHLDAAKTRQQVCDAAAAIIEAGGHESNQ